MLAPLVLAATPIPLDRAKRVFDEVRLVSEEDGGRLWGVSLHGPMLFVDPQTRFAVTNRADGEGVLKAADGVFVGTLPLTVALANTAVQWGGVEWTTVLWGSVAERSVPGGASCCTRAFTASRTTSAFRWRRPTTPISTRVFAAADEARMKLKPGWELRKDRREGDLVLAPK